MKKRISLILALVFVLLASQQALALSPLLKFVCSVNQVFDYVYTATDNGFITTYSDEDKTFHRGFISFDGRETGFYDELCDMGNGRIFTQGESVFVVDYDGNAIIKISVEEEDWGALWDNNNRFVYTNSQWEDREDSDYKSIIYDYDGNVISEVPMQISGILGENRFLYRKSPSESSEGITDAQGNVIFPAGKYDRLNTWGIKEGYVETVNYGDERQGIIDLNGNEIVPLGGDISPYETEYDYSVYSVGGDVKDKIVSSINMDSSEIRFDDLSNELVRIYKKSSDECALFNNNGDVVIGFGEYKEIRASGKENVLLLKKDENSKWEVYRYMGSEIPQISVIIGGTPLTFADQNPVIANNRTLVPLRGIFEALGAEVEWNGDTRTITAKSKDGNVTISLAVDDNRIYRNGECITIDVPAQIMNNRTMVPVRVISESLGCKVEWDGTTNTVVITE